MRPVREFPAAEGEPVHPVLQCCEAVLVRNTRQQKIPLRPPSGAEHATRIALRFEEDDVTPAKGICEQIAARTAGQQ